MAQRWLVKMPPGTRSPIVTHHDDGHWVCDCGKPSSPPPAILGKPVDKHSWCWHIRWIGLEEKKKDAELRAEFLEASQREYTDTAKFLDASSAECIKSEAARLEREAVEAALEARRVIIGSKRRIFLPK